jgi:hypothetical protein
MEKHTNHWPLGLKLLAVLFFTVAVGIILVFLVIPGVILLLSLFM